MFLRIFILSLFLYSTVSISGVSQTVKEKKDKKLQAKLEALTKNFKGDVGIYVYHLKKHKTASINADTIFPTASMIKVTILIKLLDRVEKGELKYDSMLVYRDSLFYSQTDILGSFKDSAKVPLSEVSMLTITTSDNTAALWCQNLAGTGTAINQWLSENGFQNTRVNSRTPGRELNRKIYGWGQTTPREMSTILIKMREGKIVNMDVSEQVYRHLSRIYWDGESLSQIPPYIHAASKQGAVDQSRSEVVLVNAPHGDYAFCIITKNQQDISWNINNAGFKLIKDVSNTIWKHYEKNSKWKPTANPRKWYK